MLRTALSVLGRQMRHAQSKPDWAAAYRSGAANWKSYYTDKQLAQLNVSLRSRSDRRQQIENTAAVALRAPSTVTGVVLSRLWRRSAARLTRRHQRVAFGDLRARCTLQQGLRL